MIDINLIPPALRKKSAGGTLLAINMPPEILFGVGGALILLLLIVHLGLGALWFVGYGRLSLNKAQWDKLSVDKGILDSISSQSGELKKKIAAISDITVKKSMDWPRKFNAISDALPRGLWLRRMALDKNGLTMEGSVVSKNHNEITSVGKFVSALKQDEAFMKDFPSLEVNSIQRGRRNAIEVADFTVTAKLKSDPNENKPKPNS